MSGFLKGIVIMAIIGIVFVVLMKGCVTVLSAHEPVETRPSNDRTIDGIAWPHSRVPETPIYDPRGPEYPRADELAPDFTQSAQCTSDNHLLDILEKDIRDRIKLVPDLAVIYAPALTIIEGARCEE